MEVVWGIFALVPVLGVYLAIHWVYQAWPRAYYPLPEHVDAYKAWVEMPEDIRKVYAEELEPVWQWPSGSLRWELSCYVHPDRPQNRLIAAWVKDWRPDLEPVPHETRIAASWRARRFLPALPGGEPIRIPRDDGRHRTGDGHLPPPPQIWTPAPHRAPKPPTPPYYPVAQHGLKPPRPNKPVARRRSWGYEFPENKQRVSVEEAIRMGTALHAALLRSGVTTEEASASVDLLGRAFMDVDEWPPNYVTGGNQYTPPSDPSIDIPLRESPRKKGKRGNPYAASGLADDNKPMTTLQNGYPRKSRFDRGRFERRPGRGRENWE